MRTDDFDFELPEDRIALRPAEPRESARLLHVPQALNAMSDLTIRDLPDLFEPHDVLVLNDTRVLPASLAGRRMRNGQSAKIGINLHKRVDGARWLAFARPAKKLKSGEIIEIDAASGADALQLNATVKERRDGGEVLLRFDQSGASLDASINALGAMPLPPYIASRRAADAQDVNDYQTIFARETGSVAAPTASLHFTEELLQRITGRGVSLAYVTLHVGAGTFLPIKSDTVADHQMHAEYGEISAEAAATISKARAAGGRVIAAGTTALRLIESSPDGSGSVVPFTGETDIFITPGFEFQVADALLTNFHLPKSTLFMLVCSFSGFARMQTAYRHAVDQHYRFFSYGDACFLERG